MSSPAAIAWVATLALSGTAIAGGEPIHLSLLTDELDSPVFVTAPADDERVFIVDQFDGNATGRIRIVRDGVLLTTPFLELSPVGTLLAQGLLCLAFAPDYDATGLFYVLYADAAGDVVISQFGTSAQANVADASSEQVVLMIPQPHHFHQGGWMGFGPDGYLYVSAGDGGGSNDPDHRGQDPDSLLGKILRLDVTGDDFPADAMRNYAIPKSNPFVADAPLDEIWAMGVREIWRASFDRITGDLYLADVGQEAWEEIDFEPGGFAGGANYGWRCREGDHDLWADPECPGATFTSPIHEYDHGGGRRAIIGGYVYRGSAFDALQGKYLFADHATGQIWSLRFDGFAVTELTEHAVVVDDVGVTMGQITTFGEDACGELYLATRTGQVFRIVDGTGGPGECVICPADLDDSGAISVTDLLVLLAAWGTPGSDIDGDGTTGVTDLLALLAAWGPC